MRLRSRIAPPPAWSEAELAARVLEDLAQSFHVEREVWGSHCSGRQLRIDAVLRPIDDSQWKDDEPVFGLEFKVPDLATTRDFTAWMAQAVDYTHVYWRGYGRLKVFMCPSPFMGLHDMEMPGLVCRLLGQLGVGDLCQLPYRGWSLLLHDEVVWCQKDGPVKAKYWSIRSRVGSR
ncbi:hypothetical protein ACIBQX_11620 [Nonomuraea sp. NPDC049714]|uniref:hypothetical protein n=1 Tax=Nonomuraea sp. NPDC049714 TaxID=3364357 RepID=UPI00378E1078